MKLSDYAISIDARFGGSMIENLNNFFSKGEAPDFVLRKALETTSSFEEASKLL